MKESELFPPDMPDTRLCLTDEDAAEVWAAAARSLGTEKCSRCDGTGLALNMAGEPDECPTCKGNTVAPALSEPVR
jgi:DnaJ-class molecular chaperone